MVRFVDVILLIDTLIYGRNFEDYVGHCFSRV